MALANTLHPVSNVLLRVDRKIKPSTFFLAVKEGVFSSPSCWMNSKTLEAHLVIYRCNSGAASGLSHPCLACDMPVDK